jgi:hypothetical protein
MATATPYELLGKTVFDEFFFSGHFEINASYKVGNKELQLVDICNLVLFFNESKVITKKQIMFKLI